MFKVYGNKQPIKLFNKIHKIRQVIVWIILVQEFFHYLIQSLNNSSTTKQSALLQVMLPMSNLKAMIKLNL